MSKNQGKWLEDDAVPGSKIKLANDESLRSRNAGDTADIALLKGNSVDKAEFGVEPVSSFTPSLPTSLVTRQYLDDVVAGIRDPKDAVRLSALTLPANTPSLGPGAGKILTANANAALAVDGISPSVGDRIGYLENSLHAGIYTVLQTGDGGTPWILERATDADADAEVTQGLSFDVVEGTARGKTRWLLTTDSITVDTTVLTFVEVPIPAAAVQFKEEVFTLVALDISNGYVDLANSIENQSLVMWPVGGPPQVVTSDYTLSVVSLVTRITFVGNFATTLAIGDTIVCKYAHF